MENTIPKIIENIAPNKKVIFIENHSDKDYVYDVPYYGELWGIVVDRIVFDVGDISVLLRNFSLEKCYVSNININDYELLWISYGLRKVPNNHFLIGLGESKEELEALITMIMIAS